MQENTEVEPVTDLTVVVANLPATLSGLEFRSEAPPRLEERITAYLRLVDL